jgi:flagellar hook protein FlgE
MSFQQGLSGLNASSKNLEVIGNNIANSNTFGSKVSRGEFADVYANALNGSGTNSVGIGTTLQAVSQQFTQGNITSTDNPMDLAINGAGFFQLSDGQNPPVYGRNGQFKVDRDGFIVNNGALRLMGYPADGTGVIQPGNAVALQLPSAGINPQASSEIEIEMNLDSRVATTAPAVGPAIDFGDPTTYKQRNLADRLRRQGPGRGADLLLPEVGDRHLERLRHRQRRAGQRHRGRAAADHHDQLPGQRRHSDGTGRSVTFDIPASTNSVGAQTLPMTGVTLDVTGATQYGAGFGVTNLSQNGYAPGQLTGISIEDNGIVMARYSNGQTKPRARSSWPPSATCKACSRRAAMSGRAATPRATRSPAWPARATSACCSRAPWKRATST